MNAASRSRIFARGEEKKQTCTRKKKDKKMKRWKGGAGEEGRACVVGYEYANTPCDVGVEQLGGFVIRRIAI